MHYQDFDLVRLSFVFLAKKEYQNQPYLPKKLKNEENKRKFRMSSLIDFNQSLRQLNENCKTICNPSL